MQTDRWTRVGLCIVAFGWVLLVADMTVTESMLRAGNLVAIISLRSDIVTIAQTVIISGFGVALMGLLRSGFGTLARFFEGVQHRSAMASKPVPPPVFVDAPEPDSPAPPTLGPGSSPNVAGDRPPIVSPPIRPVPAAYQAMTERPSPAASVKERNYVILADGSVEVETLLGTRIFASLDEARDFIR